MDKITKKRLIIIVGVIVLPLVYSLFYLGGFWDPYNSLNNVPVAIVNEDKCVDNQCKGDEFTKELLKNDTFDFDEVSAEKAEDGLVDEKYYAIIKIPDDFTKDLLSASEKNKKQATITYRPNTKSNYLASQILASAMKEVQMTVEKSVTEEVVGTLTSNLQSVPEKTQQISEGLGTISEGVTTLNNGTTTLKNGTSTLKNSYNTFDNGVTTALSGSAKLYTLYGKFDEGINNAYDGAALLKEKTNALPELVSGVNNLSAGSSNLATGLENYTTSVSNALTIYENLNNYCTENASSITGELKTLCETKVNSFVSDTVDEDGNIVFSPSKQLSGTAEQLNTGAKSINEGLGTLNSQTADLAALKDGIDTLADGLGQLKDNSKSVYDGIGSLNSGLNTLSSGSKEVSNGIASLDSGAAALNDGTNTLKDGVNTAKEEVDKSISETKEQTDKLDGLDKHTASAVTTKTDSYGDVNTYGIFFSPYFMSLSLWIGGLLVLIGLYYDPENRFKILGRDTKHRVFRLLGYAAIAVVQAIALGFILKTCLGFEVTNLTLYYGSCILISAAFLSIITFLIFVFGDVGKFLAIVFLVLQLASCGGTFPIETEPALYKAIYPFMPMTYSVDLLRESFVNINSNFLTKDVTILLLIFVFFSLLVIVREIYKIKKEKKNSEEKQSKSVVQKETIKTTPKPKNSQKTNKKATKQAKNKAKK